jgi:hypothetical protein
LYRFDFAGISVFLFRHWGFGPIFQAKLSCKNSQPGATSGTVTSRRAFNAQQHTYFNALSEPLPKREEKS